MKRAVILLGACTLAACEAQPPAPGAGEEIVVEAPGHHFTVDSSAYTLRADGEGWTTSIGYVFRNPTGDTIGIVNCNGAIVMDLQKREDDEWRSVWHGMSNGCLSPPIVVLPGDSIAGRLEVWGAELGHPNFPTFETLTIEGDYRLIWHHMRTGYDTELPDFGDTLTVEQKTSTIFQLARPGVHGIVHHRFDWAALDSAIGLRPDEAPALLERYRDEHGLPLSFWPRTTLDSVTAASLVAMPHPCGESMDAFVDRVPHDHPILEGELVIELDDNGVELRRWIMPSDATVKAVRGDRLLLPWWRRGDIVAWLSVAPDGTIRVEPARDATEPANVPCPELAEYDGSAYLRCWHFADLESRQQRTLAYQAVCT